MLQHTPAILELGEEFYDPVIPAAFPKAQQRYWNPSAFKEIGFERVDEKEIKNRFWSFQSFAENIPKPLALRYHGHQFGNYNPDLGDGRGFLFAQFLSKDGRLLDIGTKGSGTTPYSRRGDGRLTLKGAVREALATELLESLGVNTSKTLVIFETGEQLERNDEPSPTRSAVLSRLNHSHIRFGTFQRLDFFQQDQNLNKLVDHCLKHYYPKSYLETRSSSNEEKVEVFFREVTRVSADLVANVMMAGFVHGVLNTDNMNITGELFDYGPYRFMPEYQPGFIAAYFDHQGLYAYGRQPSSFHWNLQQLQKSLLVAAPEAQLQIHLEAFSNELHQRVLFHFRRRLNVTSANSESEEWLTQLLSLFFDFMHEEKALFEQTFFDLHSGFQAQKISRSPQADLYKKDSFTAVKKHLEAARPFDSTKENLPYFSNPRPETLLIDEIENIWSEIAEQDDWTSFNNKIDRLRAFRGSY